MSWIGTVTGVVGRRTNADMSEAVTHTANALDDLDANCRMLGDGLQRLDARQRASEALHSDHEWAIASLREELEALKLALRRTRPDASAERAASIDRTAAVAAAPDVQPSDLHGFLDALPPVDTDDAAVAAAVRTLVAAAWEDLRREPLPSDRFPWHQPILLLASAPVERLEAWLDRLVAHAPWPQLWLIGRARDRQIAASRLGAFEFVEYQAPGPYALSECQSLLPALRDVPFGALVFLDTGSWGDRLEHCVELLQAVSRENVFCYGSDDAFYHVVDSPARSRARALTRGVLDWYDARLAPVGVVAR